MRIRSLLTTLTLLAAMLASGHGAVAAGGPQDFVEGEHGKLITLLKDPPSASRDAKVQKELDAMVDYDELVRRAFGKPCPRQIPQCVNHWDQLNAAQQKEMTDLLHRLVEKNYKKNLQKTLDYEVAFKGTKDLDGGDARIRTEAKSKAKPRDPAVQIDYVVKSTDGQYRVVDIATEGSSTTKNYYDQFHKKLQNPALGYDDIVKSMKKKLAEP